jgi:EF-hand domain pair/EF hand
MPRVCAPPDTTYKSVSMLKFITLATTMVVLAAPAFAQSTTPPATTSSPTPQAETKPARTATGMLRYDANKDGVVDRAEWAAGQEARFKQLDKNGDGKLSSSELAPGGANDRSDAAFKRLDTDKDGSVSQAEFMAQADRNFARCDSDKDGKITTAECRQALKRQPVDRASTGR